jgi:hypothetical protein
VGVVRLYDGAAYLERRGQLAFVVRLSGSSANLRIDSARDQAVL